MYAIFAALNRFIYQPDRMKIRIALVLIIIAALTRILPHPHNFTPIGAIGLFSVAYFSRRWQAVAITFATLFLTDLFLNNVVYAHFFEGFAWFTSVWTYFSFLLVILAGSFILNHSVSTARVAAASLTGSLLFFLVSNGSVWLESGLYPKTFAGLMMCYTAGLPFLDNTILGDLLFSAALFGGYAWAIRQKWATAQA